MLKKTVTYTNLDGVQISKDLYFNISSEELLAKETASAGEYSAKLSQIAASNLVSEIYPVVLEFLQMGYGVRTSEGEFEKDPTGAECNKFRNSLAFVTLMEHVPARRVVIDAEL